MVQLVSDYSQRFSLGLRVTIEKGKFETIFAESKQIQVGALRSGLRERGLTLVHAVSPPKIFRLNIHINLKI